jgi:hypothetical protein
MSLQDSLEVGPVASVISSFSSPVEKGMKREN